MPQRSHQDHPWYGWDCGGDGCRCHNCHTESRCSSGWYRCHHLCCSCWAVINMKITVLRRHLTTLLSHYDSSPVTKRGFLSLPVQLRNTPIQPPEHSYIPTHNTVSKAAMLHLKKRWQSCPRLVRWHCNEVLIGGVITVIFWWIRQPRPCFLWEGRWVWWLIVWWRHACIFCRQSAWRRNEGGLYNRLGWIALL